jgi:deoxyribose-phosphate aldolase
MSYTRDEIAAALDLAVLNPMATEDVVIKTARLVEDKGIASICVAPCNVWTAKRYTDRVCAVIGFPHGNTTSYAKTNEAVQAVDEGAIELDVVINYGFLLAGRREAVRSELSRIRRNVRKIELSHRIVLKAILETCYYSREEVSKACSLASSCGFDFVKTSTGYGMHGADPVSVRAMVDAVSGTKVQVKASGDIKTYEDAAKYLDMGCTRIGSSKFWKLLPPE